MPVLAKGDQGVLTGVCQNGIDLRDSVDDKITNPGEVWRQLVPFQGRLLHCSSHVRIETWADPGALAASIEPATWHPSYRGLCGF